MESRGEAMNDICRVCAIRLLGNQRRWIFGHGGRANLQVVLSHALGQTVTRDNRGEFLCSKCVHVLERLYRFDTVISRVEALSIEKLQRLLAEKDKLGQAVRHSYARHHDLSGKPAYQGQDITVDIVGLPHVQYNMLLNEDMALSEYESWSERNSNCCQPGGCRNKSCYGCSALRVPDSEYESVCFVPRKLRRLRPDALFQLSRDKSRSMPMDLQKPSRTSSLGGGGSCYGGSVRSLRISSLSGALSASNLSLDTVLDSEGDPFEDPRSPRALAEVTETIRGIEYHPVTSPPHCKIPVRVSRGSVGSTPTSPFMKLEYNSPGGQGNEMRSESPQRVELCPDLLQELSDEYLTPNPQEINSVETQNNMDLAGPPPQPDGAELNIGLDVRKRAQYLNTKNENVMGDRLVYTCLDNTSVFYSNPETFPSNSLRNLVIPFDRKVSISLELHTQTRMRSRLLQQKHEQLQQSLAKLKRQLQDAQDEIRTLKEAPPGGVSNNRTTLSMHEDLTLENGVDSLENLNHQMGKGVTCSVPQHASLIHRLMGSLHSKEELLQDCVSLLKSVRFGDEPSADVKSALIEKLRQRLKDRDEALQRAADDKFTALESKEEEAERLRQALRDKDKDVARLTDVLQKNKEMITALRDVLQEKEFSVPKLEALYRSLQQASQERDGLRLYALHEKDSMIESLQGALASSNKDVEALAESLLGQGLDSTETPSSSILVAQLQEKERLLLRVQEEKTQQSLTYQQEVQKLLSTITSKEELLKEQLEHFNKTLASQSHEAQEMRERLAGREQELRKCKNQESAASKERTSELSRLYCLVDEKDQTIMKFLQDSVEKDRIIGRLQERFRDGLNLSTGIKSAI